MTEFRIGNKLVGGDNPVYFIDEIGANHDKSLQRAKNLIYLAKQAGADAAKFQHYKADTLASKNGFDNIKDLAHYGENPHTVFQRYEIPWEWTPELKQYCDEVGIEFMSTPYSLEAVWHLEPYVNAFKIGSGDITYHKLIRCAASTGKPMILSTGASTQDDIDAALRHTLGVPLCLMQCNTNYADSDSNLLHINLNVLTRYNAEYSINALGLSDHMSDWVGVLGAVALGAKVIEKHFTDGVSGSPDNSFAMTPNIFSSMVTETRTLEAMLGDGVKRVEENEKQTTVLQRRCWRAAKALKAGTMITSTDIVALRPAPEGSIPPSANILGRTLAVDMDPGEEFESISFDISHLL